ncbi:MAG: YbaB/EbfC family nucleoid-associated protein [Proteobacteria bacterium]|nr:YbaB/EbfC family nucleoid-associated protein [Pseudomonadota bacterium]NCA27691.1 YbaB/EbfC family nucleoid-associated protein [Pseudomonadota bacterium]
MDIKGLMRQAQQVQEKMKKIELELANKEYEGSSGGGMVKVIINGSGIAKKINIDPSLIAKDEIEILEDLIVASFNDAKKKSDDSSSDAIKSATAGIPLPPGFKI